VLDQGQCAVCRRHFRETYDPAANSIETVTFFILFYSTHKVQGPKDVQGLGAEEFAVILDQNL
jgi:hypothetical protein